MTKNDFLFTIQDNTYSWFTVKRVTLIKNVIWVDTGDSLVHYDFDNDECALLFYESITLD